MSIGLLFWMIFILAFLFGGFMGWRDPAYRPFAPTGLVLWVLIGLVGWGVFGAPIQGGGGQQVIIERR